jgi:dihydrofolate reductase
MISGRPPGLRCMTQTIIDITMSLDGYVAGPRPSLDDPLGENGMSLHEWIFQLASWREHHGLDGGVRNEDDAVVARALEGVQASVIGRKMFSGGSGPWADDPNADGWWGDEPPFRMPVFVVTHHARPAVEYANGTTFVFVTDGVEAAVAQAREAAAAGDVRVGGGASVAMQALGARLVDRIDLHVAPVLLGGGTRLFDTNAFARLDLIESTVTPNATHLSFRLTDQ